MDDYRQTTGASDVAATDEQGGADDLLTTSQAATVMGVSDAHVRRVIGTGELKATRFGGHSWMVRRADAEEWAKVERRRGPKPDLEATVPIGQLAENLERARLGATKVPPHALELALRLVAAGVTSGSFPSGADVVVTLEPGQVRFLLGRTRAGRAPIEFT